jgi:hypothetical protein
VAGYGGNLLRSGLQGLSLNTSDEVEAFLRAITQRGFPYYATKDAINADLGQWQEQNPVVSLGSEFAGAVVPGLVGAMVPGGQGATAATVGKGAMLTGKLGRLMAEPVTVATRRLMPGVLERGGRFVQGGVRGGLGILDELFTGAVQSAGQADRPQDIAPKVDEALLGNFEGSLAVRGVNKMGKKAVALPLLLADRDARARQPAPLAARRRQPTALDALVRVPAPPRMLAVRRPQEFR